MPSDWDWMEVRVPINLPGEKKTQWPTIRYERKTSGDSEVLKTLRVTDSPLQITMVPWTEEKRVIRASVHPERLPSSRDLDRKQWPRFVFQQNVSAAQVELQLEAKAN